MKTHSRAFARLGLCTRYNAISILTSCTMYIHVYSDRRRCWRWGLLPFTKSQCVCNCSPFDTTAAAKKGNSHVMEIEWSRCALLCRSLVSWVYSSVALNLIVLAQCGATCARIAGTTWNENAYAEIHRKQISWIANWFWVVGDGGGDKLKLL